MQAERRGTQRHAGRRDDQRVGQRDTGVDGGAGSATVALNAGAAALVAAGAGSLAVYGNAGGGPFIGGGAGDLLYGATRTKLLTGAGSETVALGTDDTLYAAVNPGASDLVVGAAGAFIGLGAGSARLIGLTGATVFGGAGALDMSLDGALSGSTISGGTGSLTADTVLGGAGRLDVTADGSLPSLLVAGNAGGSVLTSEQGGDTLVGAASGDQLVDVGAYPGTYLIAGAGSETLSAVINVGANGGYGAGTAAEVLSSQSAGGGNVSLPLPDGTHILLTGIASLSARQFVSF